MDTCCVYPFSVGNGGGAGDGGCGGLSNPSVVAVVRHPSLYNPSSQTKPSPRRWRVHVDPIPGSLSVLVGCLLLMLYHHKQRGTDISAGYSLVIAQNKA